MSWATCGAAPLECADVLGCGYTWQAGYQCAAVCKTSADCDPARPYCNHVLSLAGGVGPLSLCASCDPVVQRDCVGAEACVARSITAAPSCERVGVDAGAVGAPCTRASQCQRGLFCVCNDGLGIGDDCAAATGTCRKACAPSDRGTMCPAVRGQPSPGVCTRSSTVELYSCCRPPGE